MASPPSDTINSKATTAAEAAALEGPLVPEATLKNIKAAGSACAVSLASSHDDFSKTVEAVAGFGKVLSEAPWPFISIGSLCMDMVKNYKPDIDNDKRVEKLIGLVAASVEEITKVAEFFAANTFEEKKSSFASELIQAFEQINTNISDYCKPPPEHSMPAVKERYLESRKLAWKGKVFNDKCDAIKENMASHFQGLMAKIVQDEGNKCVTTTDSFLSVCLSWMYATIGRQSKVLDFRQLRDHKAPRSRKALVLCGFLLFFWLMVKMSIRLCEGFLFCENPPTEQAGSAPDCPITRHWIMKSMNKRDNVTNKEIPHLTLNPEAISYLDALESPGGLYVWARVGVFMSGKSCEQMLQTYAMLSPDDRAACIKKAENDPEFEFECRSSSKLKQNPELSFRGYSNDTVITTVAIRALYRGRGRGRGSGSDNDSIFRRRIAELVDTGKLSKDGVLIMTDGPGTSDPQEVFQGSSNAHSVLQIVLSQYTEHTLRTTPNALSIKDLINMVDLSLMGAKLLEGQVMCQSSDANASVSPPIPTMRILKAEMALPMVNKYYQEMTANPAENYVGWECGKLSQNPNNEMFAWETIEPNCTLSVPFEYIVRKAKLTVGKLTSNFNGNQRASEWHKLLSAINVYTPSPPVNGELKYVTGSMFRNPQYDPAFYSSPGHSSWFRRALEYVFPALKRGMKTSYIQSMVDHIFPNMLSHLHPKMFDNRLASGQDLVRILKVFVHAFNKEDSMLRLWLKDPSMTSAAQGIEQASKKIESIVEGWKKEDVETFKLDFPFLHSVNETCQCHKKLFEEKFDSLVKLLRSKICILKTILKEFPEDADTCLTNIEETIQETNTTLSKEHQQECESVSWHAGLWTPCVGACPGERSRQVNCLDSSGRSRPGQCCSNSSQPHVREDCSEWKYEWKKPVPFESCEKVLQQQPCHTQARSVECWRCLSSSQPYKQLANNDQCNANNQPEKEKVCMNPTPRWQLVEDWSPSTATCTCGDIQKRTYECKNHCGETLSRDECLTAKLPTPTEVQHCSYPKYSWSTWKCSLENSKCGELKRHEFCHQCNNPHKILPEKACVNKFGVQPAEEVNPLSCITWIKKIPKVVTSNILLYFATQNYPAEKILKLLPPEKKCNSLCAKEKSGTCVKRFESVVSTKNFCVFKSWGCHAGFLDVNTSCTCDCTLPNRECSPPHA